jgi:hypothetical protein
MVSVAALPDTLTLSLSLREREPSTEGVARKGSFSHREKHRMRVTPTLHAPPP